MIPYILDRYKTVKIEKKKTSLATFPQRNVNSLEKYIATVKIYHLDEDGDPTTLRIRINFQGTSEVLKYPLDKFKYENLFIGTYNDNFYFKADSISLIQ